MKFSLVAATLVIAAGVQANAIPKDSKAVVVHCPDNAALAKLSDNCYSCVDVSKHVRIEKRHHKKHTTKHHKPEHKKAHKEPKKHKTTIKYRVPKKPEHKEDNHKHNKTKKPELQKKDHKN